MKKLATVLLSASVFFFATPAISFAVPLSNLNGLTAATQTFATSTAPNSPHLLVQSSGTVHTFKWNGTPWLLNQGGTGAIAFTTGSIPFISGDVFSENNVNFFWDNVKHALGIGNSSPQHALDVSGALYSRLVTVSPSPSVTVNWNAGNVQTLTLSSNSALTFSNGQAGGEYKLILNQDATGGRTVTWPSLVKWANRTTPTLTSAANAIDMASFTFDGSNYLASLGKNFGDTPSPVSVQVLVVAGGGGGSGAAAGDDGNGGGGAGGVLYEAAHTITAQAYAITIGLGGNGGATGHNHGIQGGNSVFDTMTAIGGGYGGDNFGAPPAGNGGSGGGAGGESTVGKGVGTVGQGNDGGNGFASEPFSAGGGGGAGTAGQDGNGSGGGGGGAGIANASVGDLLTLASAGASGFIAGGGGGSYWSPGFTAGTGGSGGGGAGGDNSNGSNGTTNTGGGGGGRVVGTGATGGNGGSGIVIIAAPIGTIASATGCTHTTVSGNDVWTCTASDTWTPTLP